MTAPGETIWLLAYLRSLRYALWTTILCLLIGYPFAYFIARAKKRVQPALLMRVSISCVGEFVIPALLGGAENIMIGRVVWDEMFSSNNWPRAAALAVVMILFIMAAGHKGLPRRSRESD